MASGQAPLVRRLPEPLPGEDLSEDRRQDLKGSPEGGCPPPPRHLPTYWGPPPREWGASVGVRLWLATQRANSELGLPRWRSRFPGHQPLVGGALKRGAQPLPNPKEKGGRVALPGSLGKGCKGRKVERLGCLLAVVGIPPDVSSTHLYNAPTQLSVATSTTARAACAAYCQRGFLL